MATASTSPTGAHQVTSTRSDSKKGGTKSLTGLRIELSANGGASVTCEYEMKGEPFAFTREKPYTFGTTAEAVDHIEKMLKVKKSDDTD